MRRVLPILIVLGWALWVGGLVMLFIAVSSLFKTFELRRDLAGLAASRIFHLSNIYQLVLAAVTLLALALYRPAGKHKPLLLGLLGVAAAGALVSTLELTPLIERLRTSGLTHTPQFAKLHGISMAVNAVQTLLLILSATLLPSVLAQPDPRRE